MQLVTTVAGDCIVDTVQTITPWMAKTIKDKGYMGVLRYVTSVQPEELGNCFAVGLAMGFVTYANDLAVFTQAHALMSRLGTPKGHHVFLDIEGASKHAAWQATDPRDVSWQMAAERAWCEAILGMGYVPARYAGADQRLTGREQYLLPHRLYWHACSDVRDRNGAESVPDCSYAMYQDTHYNQTLAPGLVVDVNAVVGDMTGRTPILVGA